MARNEELSKLLRIFRLIEMLSSSPLKTTKQLAERLEVDRKTVERYYKLLEKVGYLVDSNDAHQYFIQVEKEKGDAFTHEEANYLNDVLASLPDDNPLRSALRIKVNKQYRLLPVLQNLQRHTYYDKLRELQRAAEAGLIVKLFNYVGGDGKISAERRVAVTGFTHNNAAIKAHDLDIDEGREFKLSRMGLLEVTAEEVPREYPFYPSDVFGWPGTQWKHIRLRLSPRAKQLWREEFPLIAPYLTDQRDGSALADLRVRGWEAIGFQVLGLPNEIDILPGGQGEEFREYLNSKNKTW